VVRASSVGAHLCAVPLPVLQERLTLVALLTGPVLVLRTQEVGGAQGSNVR
jgi:hypothetical protein